MNSYKMINLDMAKNINLSSNSCAKQKFLFIINILFK